MKRKDVPELYEVLKKSNVDITKTSGKDNAETFIKEENTVKVGELNTLPSQIVKPPITNVFPKLKSSFIKERVKTQGEKQISLSYSNAIFLVLVIIVLLAAAFVIGVQISGKITQNINPASSNTNSPALTQGTSQNKPPVPTTAWVIRVVYYDSNSTGRKNANQMVKRLKDKHITNAYTAEDNIQNRSQICVYLGPYLSKSEAENALKSLKTEHRDINFNNSKTVESRR